MMGAITGDIVGSKFEFSPSSPRSSLKVYGNSFSQWLVSKNPEPYNSWGNGSDMRVSACGELAEPLGEALFFADKSAIKTYKTAYYMPITHISIDFCLFTIMIFMKGR